MKKRIAAIVWTAFIMLALSARADANWEKLTYQEVGALYVNENGEAYGCNEEARDAWMHAIWELGGFTTMEAYMSLYEVDGIVYNTYGTVYGYTDSHTPNEARYWTTNDDPYYHRDADCDRGTKYPISAEAAETFKKRLCPACMQIIQPKYYTEEETGNEADGTTVSDFEYYAGEYTNEAGELVYLLSDIDSRETHWGSYDFTSQIKGNYWLIYVKNSLSTLSNAKELITTAAEANPLLKSTIHSLDISIQNNAVILKLLNPSADEIILSINLPPCVQISYERDPPLE